jgi:allantoin racemase
MTAAGRRVLLINPNTTVTMTESMAAQLRGHLGAHVHVEAVTAAFGHPVIASRVCYAIAADAALDAYARFAGQEAGAGGFDAVVLGCFGDPGLEALREVASAPVIGVAEASFHAAAALRSPFAVLTLGPAWRAMLEERLALHPAGSLCRKVRALEGTGLDMVRDPGPCIAALDRAAAELASEGAETVVPGGAVLAGLAPRLRTPVCFLDPLAAAAYETQRRWSR